MGIIEITFPLAIPAEKFPGLVLKAIQTSYPESKPEDYQIVHKGFYNGENLYSVSCARPTQFYKVGFVVAIFMNQVS
jgi:hypothetical protein